MADWREVPDLVEPEVSVVVPCRNEAERVGDLVRAVSNALAGESFELLIVDDASTDDTAMRAGVLSIGKSWMNVLRLVANVGQQAALRAGLRAAKGRFVVTLDADLEHPPAYLPRMLHEARQGHDVVQMVRRGDQPGLFKNLWSRLFYRFFNAMAETPVPPGTGDFRLLSRRVCDVINALPERRIFLRALLPQLGFATRILEYSPGPARRGAPSYTFGRSWRMGVDALFAHSTVPLKWALRAGLIVAAAAFAYALFNVGAKFIGGRNVPGYTDLIASVLFLGGLILLYLGILGRYLLVILDYLKNRPEYLIVSKSPPPRRSYPSPPFHSFKNGKGVEG